MPSAVLIFAVEVLVIQLGQQYFIKQYKYAGLTMILELKSNLLFLVRVFAMFSLCSAIFIMHHLVVIPVGSLHLFT